MLANPCYLLFVGSQVEQVLGKAVFAVKQSLNPIPCVCHQVEGNTVFIAFGIRMPMVTHRIVDVNMDLESAIKDVKEALESAKKSGKNKIMAVGESEDETYEQH